MNNVTFELFGQNTNGVRDWQGLQILATFDNGNAQANITTGELRFVGEAGRALIAHIDSGAAGLGNGIYDAPEFNIILSSPIYSVFKGIIDLSDNIVIDRDKSEVSCKIKQLDGLNTFENISEAITFGLLENKGVFTTSDYSDIPYIKEIEFEFLAAALLAISIYTLSDKLITITKDTAKNISVAAAGIGGPAVSLIWIALEIAYAVTLVILLIKLADDLFDYLLVSVKYHRGIRFDTMLSKAIGFSGYTFHSSIPELSKLYYLPRKTKEGKRGNGEGSGLPTSGEPFYTLGGAISLAKRLFGAKIKIKGKDLYLEPLKNEAFWNQDSDYVMPPVLITAEKYNTKELKSTKLIQFDTDDRDAFTLSNYRGTVLEVKTIAKTDPADKRMNLLAGVEDVPFQVCLGTRKDELNLTENILLSFANAVDGLINLFGGNADYSSRIAGRIGMLKMSSDLVAKPKLMLMDSNRKMPTNHRDLWGARFLYDNYLNHFSFVLNNYRYQYKLYEKIKMHANLSDFIKVINSNRARTADGKVAEIDSILWHFAKNYWEADFRVRHIFTKNLEETYTEPL